MASVPSLAQTHQPTEPTTPGRLRRTALVALTVLGVVTTLLAGGSAGAAPYRKVTADDTAPAGVAGPSVSLRIANLNTDFALGRAAYLAQLRMLKAERPQVIFLQETAERTRLLRSWAKRNGYRVYLPGGIRKPWKNASVVLWRNNGRFKVLGYEARLGSHPLTRPGGGHIGARYLATVRVWDRLSRQALALTSTHATPNAWRKVRGVNQPWFGTETYAGFQRHMRATKNLVAANGKRLTILAGDFNSPARFEAEWRGFQTHRFGDALRSNHEAFGIEQTYDTGGSLDYVYVNRSRRIGFARQRFIDTYSDHRAMVMDLRIRKR